MKTHTLLALAVMAAAGCQSMEERGYVKNIYGEWMKPGQRYFGDATPEEIHRNIIRRRAQAYDPAFWRTGPDQPIIAQHPFPQYPALSFGP